ncbi:MAG TPA: FtsX-like permease family protein [Puia sp.]|jgi:ABC-type antimicrobial peptide transport system permease subunit
MVGRLLRKASEGTKMIRNYFLTAWRNLKKNKLNATVNILGLTVAFTCCILLFLTVYREFSYDDFQLNKAHLYKVYGVTYDPNGDQKGDDMSYPMGPAIKAEVPGVVKVSSIMNGGSGIRYRGKEIDKGISLVDNDFFSMFSFPILSGDKAAPLGDPGKVVINESVATALFGKEFPVGKIVGVKITGQWKDLMVSAVIEDAPSNSSIRCNILARIELNGNYPELKNVWDAQHHPVYVQAASGVTQQQLEKSMRQLVRRHHLVNDEKLKSEGYRHDVNGDFLTYKFLPFEALHFDTELGTGNTISKSYLYILVIIAIVVMVIACFNFINLNVARAFTRAREVGIRKTIGAGKRQIFLQLWTESLLLCLIAITLAVLITLTVLRPFNTLFTEKLELKALLQPSVLIITLTGVLLVSFLAGGYPAWLVARFQVVEILKGKISVNRASWLRNGLITFQFVMASLLICGTMVIYGQFEHLQNASLGFEQESIISIPVRRAENTPRYLTELRAKLGSQPQVISMSGSSVNVGIGEDGSQSQHSVGFDWQGRSIMTDVLTVDYDFLKTMGIKPVAGRDFSPAYPSDTSALTNTVVVTESMARQFGLKDVLGLSFYPDSSKPKWNIIGVIPDIRFSSMRAGQNPLSLRIRKGQSLDYILVKVRTDNPINAMTLVSAAYKTIEPDNEIKPSYLTENTRRWYDREQRLSSIFCSAAVIAILLSCLGLFAIVSLVMEQRRKEIGVRKVLGASLPQITRLLSGDFVKLVILAFVLATPIAWYALSKWLENFIYHISIGWWIFPTAGVVTLFIAMATISLQTIRAALANPVENLRSE